MGPNLAVPRSFLEAAGLRAIGWGRSLEGAFDFLGRTTLALARRDPPTSRPGREFVRAMQEAGVDTLPLVALVSFAIGGVLALVGVQQLDRIGGLLLAPNLVAIVMLREMGALMTGICLAGRLGSTTAAELATERASAPGPGPTDDRVFDEHVVPRILALVLMGPLLVLYANGFGLLGSVAVGVGLMDVSAADYVERTRAALSVKHAVAGLLKGAAFGLVVGLAGCYHGLRSGPGPAAVGRAVRRAVVAAVLLVVFADAALTVFFKWVRL